jgi:hypothetical protein
MSYLYVIYVITLQQRETDHIKQMITISKPPTYID